MITVSLVTHGHGDMVTSLIDRLLELPEVSQIVLTCNVPEQTSFKDNASGRLIVKHNQRPNGFGANHNAAFSYCRTPYFCVLNPDVQLPDNPFCQLVKLIESSNFDLVAPIVLSPLGNVENSARHFPTLKSLIIKRLGGYDGRYFSKLGDPPFAPDWVAGMFMLFRRSAYEQLCGFDERFYLYFEDVDICRRAKRKGFTIRCCPQTFIIHKAQRASGRNLRHMRWHLTSMFRYLFCSN